MARMNKILSKSELRGIKKTLRWLMRRSNILRKKRLNWNSYSRHVATTTEVIATGSQCRFPHHEKVCEAFENEGVCLNVECRDRHRSVCRNWRQGKCYRGKSCGYRHTRRENEDETVNSVKCLNDYCSFCINEEANEPILKL